MGIVDKAKGTSNTFVEIVEEIDNRLKALEKEPPPPPPPPPPPSPSDKVQFGAPVYDWAYTIEESNWIAENLDFMIMERSRWTEGKLKPLNNHMKAINPDIITTLYKPWSEVESRQVKLEDVIQDWLDQAIKYNFNGIFIDICKCIGDQGEREKEFFSRAYPIFCQAQKILIPNLDGCKYGAPDDWRREVNVTHGGLEEAFATICVWIPSQPYLSEEVWKWQLEQMAYTASQDKLYVALGQNNGNRLEYAKYNIASFLMGRSGQKNKEFFYSGPQATYHLGQLIADHSAYEIYYRAPLGTPQSNAYKSNIIWHRDFEQGKVLVNPSENTHTVEFDQPYKKVDDTEPINRLTMGAHDAEILLVY